MSEFILATVSTADMEEEYLHAHGIPFLMYPYTVGDKVLMDDCKQETRNLTYKLMRAGELTTTSMINAHTYFEFFDSLMQQGSLAEIALDEPDVSLPLEKRDAGGLGILLVRRMMDEVHYSRKGTLNSLRIVVDTPRMP